MKIFYDTEFHYYNRKNLFGKSFPTLDFISIGMVNIEDGSDLYLISKEFDLKAAFKDEWLRNNVLKKIHIELQWERNIEKKVWADKPSMELDINYLYKKEPRNMRRDLSILINKYGKSNKEIADCICEFMGREVAEDEFGSGYYVWPKEQAELYAYYSAYDHVALCSLFGRMIDLPFGVPMYTNDLKSMFDQKVSLLSRQTGQDFNELLTHYKSTEWYPKESDDHNALSDAKWNAKLYDYINNI